VASYNPIFAEERRQKRQKLLAATEKGLKKIAKEVSRRTKTPFDKAEIGKKVGNVINRYKVGKHFAVMIEDGASSFSPKEKSIRRESELDGIYVIRTSESAERICAEGTVRR